MKTCRLKKRASDPPTTTERSPKKAKSSKDDDDDNVDKYLLLTKESNKDIDVAMRAAFTLGGCKIIEDKDDFTKATHVVLCGETFGGRTYKSFYGIAHGLWVVSSRWLLDSAKAGNWLGEEKYEEKKRLPGSVLARKAIKSKNGNALFEGASFFLGSDTPLSHDELRNLITSCKGKVAKAIKTADIILAESHVPENAPDGTPVVNTKWLTESISHFKLANFKEYEVK